MGQPVWTKGNQRQSSASGFFVWLGDNLIPVGVILILIAVGITAFLALNTTKHREKPEEAEKPQWTLKDWREAKQVSVECLKDLHCRQLKRIKAEGGASPEAVRNNLLAADRSLTFEQLQENASRYEGMPWAFEGKIYDIIGEERRGMGDYILAEIIIGDDQAKKISVRGDFVSDFRENDYVYVVGYITGTSHPRLGPSSLKFKGKVPSLSARAFLKPSEAREILSAPR